MNVTILNLGVSLLFFKHSVSLFSAYILLSCLPSLIWPGCHKGGNTSQVFIACPLHALANFCSPEKLSLLVLSVKPFETVQHPEQSLFFQYSCKTAMSCFGEAVKELKACGVSKKCRTAAVKYCYKSQLTSFLSDNSDNIQKRVQDRKCFRKVCVSCKDIRNVLSPRATQHKIHINLNETVKFQHMFTEISFQSRKNIACCSHVQMEKAVEVTTVCI